ncbi:MAG: hypothetical protein VX978_01155, partial [Pseudomonadota bacterium]|nr:hypothetical protein [Pseudomonadota bacterium]
ASRPIFSKVMLSSDKNWIIALTHDCFVCRCTNALTRRDPYTAQAPNNPRKMARVAKPKFGQEPKQSQSTTLITLGDFHMFFCVMGLEGDTVCINNATHT